MPRDILTWIRSHLDDGEAVFRDGRRIVGRAIATLSGNNTFTGNNVFSGNVTVAGRLINTGGAQPSEVRFATTTNDSLSGLAARDGVTPVAGDRALVKDHATGTSVGIYVAAAGAWARAVDLPVGASAAGLLVIVHEGTLNGDKTFVCTDNLGADVVGTDALTFERTDLDFAHLSGAETFTGRKTAAAGLTLATAQTLLAGVITLIGAVTDRLNAAYLAITGQAIGDLLVADSVDTFARLPDVAVGQVLKSGGVGAAPAYGAIGGTTAADGTGATSQSTAAQLFGFMNLAAAGTSRCTPLAASAAGPFAGFSNPAIPRAGQIVFGVGWDGGAVTVHGTNWSDVAIDEVFADPGAGGATVQGTKAFKTYTAAEKGAVGISAATAELQDGNAIGVVGSVQDGVGILTADGIAEPVVVDPSEDTFTPTTSPNGAVDFALLVNVAHNHTGPSHTHGGTGLT